MGAPVVSDSQYQVGDSTEVAETQKANQLFLERIRTSPGVVHVEPFGGANCGGQSFRVYLRDGDLKAEYGVYELTGEILDQYPEARLDVTVLEESDLPRDPSSPVTANG